MGKRLGVETIARYARKFRLGKMAGIDVGQEKEGLVPSRAWKQEKFGVSWQEGETISMSIGQSFLLVTPIQAATTIASIFNGGFLYRPQVTKWVGRSETETIQKFTPKVAGKINFSQDHLEIVKNALIGVVNEAHGTGSKAKVENITVAGKTGTAQVVAVKENEEPDDGENGIPAHHRDHAWFVAVAPAERPKIAVAVVIEHGGHGGSAAAPIARDLIAFYLKDLNS